MEEYLSYLEIFEQYHDDLRKIKKIFKLSNVNFLKFYENMQGVISDCNPNSKWFRNDEVFLLIKKNISNYMNMINEHAKAFINLHKFLKDYGNNFKEFKKKIYSKVKTINFCKTSQKERLPNETFDLNNEILKKFEELDYYLLSSYQKFEKILCFSEELKTNFQAEKTHSKQSNGQKSRCVTPNNHSEGNNKHYISIKSQINQNSSQTNKLKKLSFQNHETIILNKESASVKNHSISIDKDKNVQSSSKPELKNSQIVVENDIKKKQSNVHENEKELADNKSQFSSNKENVKDESNFSEMSDNSYKSDKRKSGHKNKPSLSIHN